jgi:hypothetical protein
LLLLFMMGNQYFWWASKIWDSGCPGTTTPLLDFRNPLCMASVTSFSSSGLIVYWHTPRMACQYGWSLQRWPTSVSNTCISQFHTRFLWLQYVIRVTKLFLFFRSENLTVTTPQDWQSTWRPVCQKITLTWAIKRVTLLWKPTIGSMLTQVRSFIYILLSVYIQGFRQKWICGGIKKTMDLADCSLPSRLDHIRIIRDECLEIEDLCRVTCVLRTMDVADCSLPSQLDNINYVLWSPLWGIFVFVWSIMYVFIFFQIPHYKLPF